MYLIYFLNIDILALNYDILPDILNNDILSSFWKQGKYKIFMHSPYPNRSNKTMVARECCCGVWVVSDGVGPKGRGAQDLFGVLDVQKKFLWEQGWLIGVAVTDVYVGWWGQNSLKGG